jgi:hypothetical protein
MPGFQPTRLTDLKFSLESRKFFSIRRPFTFMPFFYPDLGGKKIKLRGILIARNIKEIKERGKGFKDELIFEARYLLVFHIDQTLKKIRQNCSLYNTGR